MFAILAVFYSYLIAANAAIDPKFQDCGSKTGKLNDISVTGCDQGDHCIFKAGTNVSFSATFTSNTKSDVANVKVHGVIGGIPIPFPINPENACGNYGVKCPLTPGSTDTVKLAIPVLKSYPPVSCKVKFQLIDSSSSDLFCVEFPVKIEH